MISLGFVGLLLSNRGLMLNRSFVHLEGIGLSTEKKLWSMGVASWDALSDFAPSYFEGDRLMTVKRGLEATYQAWEKKDLYYFYQGLPRPELWRLVPEFLEEIAYLDIETNGLKLPPVSQSTTVTFCFQGQLYQEHDPRLKKKLIEKMDAESSLFCSFFGEVFDVPFLRKEFGLPLRKAHLDLCFWLKRLGFFGGLKKIEKEFPEVRRRESFDIEGLDAVRLWQLHLKGVPGALETLLTYNAEDTVVLETLLVKAYNLEVEKRPQLNLPLLDFRKPIAISTKVDIGVYERLKASRQG